MSAESLTPQAALKPSSESPAEGRPACIARALGRWYASHGRDLPWRRTRDPYRVWVSEVLLQQTQVETAVPYYFQFLERFPTVDHLARAELSDVLKAWENLGYYARARNLHAAAGEVSTRFHGRIPDTWQELASLPGIGPYTAGAILSIAFGQPFSAVDGNIRRVLSRLFVVREPMDTAATKRRLQQIAGSIVSAGSPGEQNQSLMDLGALICKPTRPRCTACPVRSLCEADRLGLANELPKKGNKKPVPKKTAAVGILRNAENQLLLLKRPSTGFLGGLWKFPGGVPEGDGDMGGLLARNVLEELGAEIRVGRRLATIEHAYTHFRVTVHAFICRFKSEDPSIRCRGNWCWAGEPDLHRLALSRMERKVIAAILPQIRAMSGAS